MNNLAQNQFHLVDEMLVILRNCIVSQHFGLIFQVGDSNCA